MNRLLPWCNHLEGSILLTLVYWVSGLGANLGFSQESGAAAEKMPATYSACKSMLLESFDSKSLEFEKGLEKCKLDFPAHILATKCKERLVKAPKNRRKKLKARCNRIQRLVDSYRDQDIPFLWGNDRLFVDGVNFSEVRPFSWLSQAPFNCSAISKMIAEDEEFSYSFYGYDLDLVENRWKGKTSGKEEGTVTDLVAKYALQLESVDEKQKNGKTKKNRSKKKVENENTASDVETSMMYFPVGRCDYKYSGEGRTKLISLFYLIDKVKKNLYPYSAVFFYDQGNLPRVRASEKIVAKQSLNTAKSRIARKQKLFFSGRAVSDFDSEMDPKNLCEKKHFGFLASLIKNPQKKNRVATAVVSNISSYCQFMDSILSTQL